MLLPIAFTIDGPVVGKGRGRAVAIEGGGARVFTPKKTENYQARVSNKAQEVMAHRDPIDGPVDLDLTVICQIPTTWPAWKKQAALDMKLWPTTKPDFDNIVKLLADGLNEIVWTDDSRVVSARVMKFYGTKPGLRVKVTPMLGLAAQTSRRPVESVVAVAA